MNIFIFMHHNKRNTKRPLKIKKGTYNGPTKILFLSVKILSYVDSTNQIFSLTIFLASLFIWKYCFISVENNIKTYKSHREAWRRFCHRLYYEIQCPFTTTNCHKISYIILTKRGLVKTLHSIIPFVVVSTIQTFSCT